MKRASGVSDFFLPRKKQMSNTAELDLDPGLHWKLVSNGCLRGIYVPADTGELQKMAKKLKENGDNKLTVPVAAFDLDSTLTLTRSGMPWPRDGSDWKWFSGRVVESLRGVHQGGGKEKTQEEEEEDTDEDTSDDKDDKENVANDTNGNDSKKAKKPSSSPPAAPSPFPVPHQPYIVVIITNQGSVIPQEGRKRYAHFKERMENVTAHVDIPMMVYAACKLEQKRGAAKVATKAQQDKDPLAFRKPGSGLWTQMKTDLAKLHMDVDLEQSFYVGDAAGRTGDFADSDKGFAKNVGIQFFTPEQFFHYNPTKEKRRNGTPTHQSATCASPDILATLVGQGSEDEDSVDDSEVLETANGQHGNGQDKESAIELD